MAIENSPEFEVVGSFQYGSNCLECVTTEEAACYFAEGSLEMVKEPLSVAKIIMEISCQGQCIDNDSDTLDLRCMLDFTAELYDTDGNLKQKVATKE